MAIHIIVFIEWSEKARDPIYSTFLPRYTRSRRPLDEKASSPTKVYVSPMTTEVISVKLNTASIDVIDSGEAVEKRVESLLDKFSLRCAEDNEPRLEFLSYADEEYRARLEHKALR